MVDVMLLMMAAACALNSSLQSGWKMTFDDEFDGAKGAAVDPTKWGYDVGGNGWGNNELESYTSGNHNAYLDGEGHLIIEARREETTGPDGHLRGYSSARLLTRGKFSQTYGRFEARIKIPQGKGIWPAFWLLGDNISKAGWPGCGEVDILESIGVIANIAYGTLHGPGYSGGNGIQGKFNSTVSLADDFHIYRVDWNQEAIRWYIDNVCFHTVSRSDPRVKGQWVFDGPCFIIMNMAVGGGWPGNPNESTTFPQKMVVDWVRVFQHE